MLQHTLKIALRNLRTQRSYTLLNIIGLSVGMASGLFLFLFVDHHMSTDRHHANYDRIYRIDTDMYLDDGSIEYNPEAPLPMAQALRTNYPQVEQAAFLMMLRELTVGIKPANGRVPLRFQEHTGAGLVEPEWFDILDYTWLRGNPKTALREPNTVVLTESWAKKYFGAVNPIGRVLKLNNVVDVTVTGLLAEPPATTDTNLGLFVSLTTLKALDPQYDVSDWGWLNSMNRVYMTLKNPAAAPALERTMPALARKQYGANAKYFRFHVQPMREFHFDVVRGGTTIRASLLWSLGVVGVLLILAACINFVNLATAQALRRGKEVGIRKTLGSSRRQLVGQFLLETALIIGAALSLALLLVLVFLPLFSKWVQLNLPLRPDGPTIGFMAGLLISVIGLAGGYPALVLSGFSPMAALRGKLTVTPGGGFMVRRVLVVVQFAVCQALILGSLVVANQVRYMQRADLGFRKDNVVIVTMPYGQKAKQESFKQQLASRTDIQSVSLSHLTPSSVLLFGGSFKFNGSTEWSKFPIRNRLADADYLNTYGIKLLAGRNITPGDTIRDYVINETLLHKLGFRDPQQVLGNRLQCYLSSVPLPIVGVVRDFRQKSLRDEIEPCFIASQSNWYERAGIRIAGDDPTQTLSHIRQTWQQLFPDEVFEYEFLDQQIAQLYQTETLINRLINVFTGVAILICCLGLYGLVAYAVTQRTKEIGIRKVLGASVAGIVALLSTDFLKLVLIGVVIASPIAGYVMNRWLQEFAYRVDMAWWVFAGAGTLAIVIALLTVSYQSIRAALVNPVTSLRSE